MAKADAIAGSTVAGKLVVTGQGKYNQFSTTGGTAAVNATVGSGVEFSETEYVMEDFADFTGTGLTVTIACIKTVNCSGSSDYPFVMTFTDLMFTGYTLSTLTNNLDLTSSLSGDTLTLTYSGLYEPPGNTVSTFAFTPAVAATPEPESLVLLGSGLLSVVGMARRRRA